MDTIAALLSGVMKRFGHFGCTEQVCDALKVVCHRREADFDPDAGQPAHQQSLDSRRIDALLLFFVGFFDAVKIALQSESLANAIDARHSAKP